MLLLTCVVLLMSMGMTATTTDAVAATTTLRALARKTHTPTNAPTIPPHTHTDEDDEHAPATRFDPALVVNLFIYASLLAWTWSWACSSPATSSVTTTTLNNIPAPQDRDEVDAFPRRVAGATSFRVMWLVFGVLGIWTRSRNEDGTCRDPHLLVELLGFLAQLGFFSAFLGLLTVWWDAVRADDARLAERASTGNDPAAAARLLQAWPTTTSPAQTTTDATTTTTTTRTATVNLASARAAAWEQAEAPRYAWSLLCAPKTLQILFNFWVYVVVLSLFIVRFQTCGGASTPQQRTAERLADAQTAALAASSGVMSAGFLRVGTRLAHKLRRAPRVRSRVLLVTLVCFVAFLVRSVLFLVRPITGYRFQGVSEAVLYPWFFYTFPEVVPTAVVLVVSRSSAMAASSSSGSFSSSSNPTAAAHVVVLDPTESTSLLPPER